jgi:hypothetical protein
VEQKKKAQEGRVLIEIRIENRQYRYFIMKKIANLGKSTLGQGRPRGLHLGLRLDV